MAEIIDLEDHRVDRDYDEALLDQISHACLDLCTKAYKADVPITELVRCICTQYDHIVELEDDGNDGSAA